MYTILRSPPLSSSKYFLLAGHFWHHFVFGVCKVDQPLQRRQRKIPFPGQQQQQQEQTDRPGKLGLNTFLPSESAQLSSAASSLREQIKDLRTGWFLRVIFVILAWGVGCFSWCLILSILFIGTEWNMFRIESEKGNFAGRVARRWARK